MRTLIVYFSRAGFNWFGGEKRAINKGNTQVIAEYIAKYTQGTLFSIDMLEPYSDDYDQCCNEAKLDLTQNKRPQIVDKPLNIDEYDVIYIGYPIYWSTFPMAIYSFIEKYHQTIKLFIRFALMKVAGLAHLFRS